MKVKGWIVASAVVAALLTGLAWITAGHLPAGAHLPVHWGAGGSVRGWR